MSKFGKVIIALVIVLLVAGIAMLSYFVYARKATNDYILDSTLAFNAATMVNADQSFLDPQRAVIAEFQGQRVVISPDNYRALLSLLQKQCVMPPFRRVRGEGELVITVCDDVQFHVCPDGDTGDEVLLRFDSSSHSRTMHLYGGNLYSQLINLCTRGSTRYKNIPLENAE